MRVAGSVRGLHTSAAAHISRRAQRITKRKNDEALRQAVSLYHLTPSFYPIPRGADDTELGEAVTESILGQFYGERDGRPFVQFASTSELLSQYRQDVQSGRKDTLGELDMYDTLRIQHTLASDMPGRTHASAEAAEGPMRVRQHFVHQPSAYATRRARDAAGHGDLYSNEEMSTRSAQVRDALFGTVAGELPGLEVVRERERAWKKEAQDDE
ncbi:hypothetical protein CBS9595_003925 [Malassezia furfur]|nr:hypothetical protein CBS9595_003925 [Malassezia furfur]